MPVLHLPKFYIRLFDVFDKTKHNLQLNWREKAPMCGRRSFLRIKMSTRQRSRYLDPYTRFPIMGSQINHTENHVLSQITRTNMHVEISLPSICWLLYIFCFSLLSLLYIVDIKSTQIAIHMRRPKVICPKSMWRDRLFRSKNNIALDGNSPHCHNVLTVYLNTRYHGTMRLFSIFSEASGIFNRGHCT